MSSPALAREGPILSLPEARSIFRLRRTWRRPGGWCRLVRQLRRTHKVRCSPVRCVLVWARLCPRSATGSPSRASRPPSSPSATVLAAVPSAAGDLGTPGLDDSDPLFLPLRWCAVQGSPAVTNPAGVGEPDTDSVLWRRHERATDYIWFPGALISFRSAFTAGVVTSGSYPVIADPHRADPGSPATSTPSVAAAASSWMPWQAAASPGTRSRWPSGASWGGRAGRGQLIDASGTPSSLWGTSTF